MDLKIEIFPDPFFNILFCYLPTKRRKSRGEKKKFFSLSLSLFLSCRAVAMILSILYVILLYGLYVPDWEYQIPIETSFTSPKTFLVSCHYKYTVDLTPLAPFSASFYVHYIDYHIISHKMIS